MHDLDNLGRAFELKNLAGMIKVEQKQYTHQAMRAIGSGFQSVLFADIRTVADAEVVRRGGARGNSRHRRPARRRHAARCGTVLEGGSPAYVDALNEVVIAIMVEKRECVEDLEAILSVPGIDMVQFGSSDYSMSLGLTGQRSHPDVVKAERKTIETALKNGQASACGTGGYLGREAVPGDGREALLHRVGCADPVQLVAHERGRTPLGGGVSFGLAFFPR